MAHRGQGLFCSVRRTYERSCKCDHKPVAQVCQNPKDGFQVDRSLCIKTSTFCKE